MVSLFVAGSSSPAFAAFRTWTGAGANNLWTTPQNWDGNVAPVADDILAFPLGAPQTTNVNNFPAGTLFRTLTFSGTYVVSGNRLQLSGSLSVAGAAGITVVIQCDITNGGGTADYLFVGVNPGTILVTTGVISGAEQIQKGGTGLWNIGGASPNTFNGRMRVNVGTLVLNKPAGVAAVPAGLVIGSNTGAAD